MAVKGSIMKMHEIKEMTDAEVNSRLEELLKEKFNLKIQSKTGQLENTARCGQVRRNIAQVKTEQKNRLAQSDS